MEKVLIMVIAFLCVVVVFRDALHFIERNSLCDRLMSNSLSEYKREKEGKRSTPLSAHRAALRRWRDTGGDKS
jgi:hypothetical protein